MQDTDATAKAGNTAPVAVGELPAHFRVGDLLVDTEAQTVRRVQDSVMLPHLSWLLLVDLARRWPAVASQEELMADLWPDVFVGEETLTQRVKLLRQSLEDDSRNPRYIKTVRGTGYRLAAAVEKIVGGQQILLGGHRDFEIGIGLVKVVDDDIVEAGNGASHAAIGDRGLKRRMGNDDKHLVGQKFADS